MRDWSCSVEFTLISDNPNREADEQLTRRGVRSVPQNTGHYIFTDLASHEDYLQALLGTVGKLDAILKANGIAREIYACQVAEMK